MSEDESYRMFGSQACSLVAMALCLVMSATFMAQAQDYSPDELARRTLKRRAVEAVIWGMPAVNFDLMFQAFLGVKGGPNQIAFWSKPLDWKNQTLTPNPDTIYFMPFYNTKDGPVVLEIPPADEGSITGSIDDGWQNALEDVGPAGVDKGKGGKYLILPPEHKGKVPPGYIPLQSDTYQGFALLRSNLKGGSPADIAKAVGYGKQVKLYLLSEVGKKGGQQTKFVDAYGRIFDSTIPYDARFFESLNRFVQAEPWLVRDKAMIDILKTVGIEKGKPFLPDTPTKVILEGCAKEARALIERQYENSFLPPFNEGQHWALPVSPAVLEGMPNFFANRNSYPTDGRAVMYATGYFSAKRLGAGQFYLMTIKDKADRRLDGGNVYRLTVPPDVPVSLYWSATVYDAATHTLIRNTRWYSRSSHTPGLEKNADGSIDLFFGSTPPDGKESNWVPTSADGGFEVLFRFYGPEKPLFQKTWVLPDIERME
jgi:hypothetical protein